MAIPSSGNTSNDKFNQNGYTKPDSPTNNKITPRNDTKNIFNPIVKRVKRNDLTEISTNSTYSKSKALADEIAKLNLKDANWSKIMTDFTDILASIADSDERSSLIQNFKEVILTKLDSEVNKIKNQHAITTDDVEGYLDDIAVFQYKNDDTAHEIEILSPKNSSGSQTSPELAKLSSEELLKLIDPQTQANSLDEFSNQVLADDPNFNSLNNLKKLLEHSNSIDSENKQNFLERLEIIINKL